MDATPTIVNLLRMTLQVCDGEGRTVITLPGADDPVRLVELSHAADPPSMYGVPVTQLRVTGVVGLPDPRPDTWYVVPRIVATHLARTRRDLVAPGRAMRHPTTGRLIGCIGLVTVHPEEST